MDPSSAATRSHSRMQVDEGYGRIGELRVRDHSSLTARDREGAGSSNLARRQLLGDVDRRERDVVCRRCFESSSHDSPYSGGDIARIGLATRDWDVRLIVQRRLYEDAIGVVSLYRRSVRCGHDRRIAVLRTGLSTRPQKGGVLPSSIST